jgi:hypothetical protein
MINCFGRHEHDPVLLAKAPAHRFGLTVAPAMLQRTLVDFKPRDFSNQVNPICTFESYLNAARGVAFLNKFDLVVAQNAGMAGYAACVGVPPTPQAIAATDGATMLSVADWQAKNQVDIGPQKLVARIGTVAVNRMALAKAMARLGPLWCGVRILQREMDTTSVWDVRPGRDDGALVGLHALMPWSYMGLADQSLVWIGTWARWQAVTWAWIAARMDEAHGCVWRQLGRSDGFYNGLTADGLVAEL